MAIVKNRILRLLSLDLSLILSLLLLLWFKFSISDGQNHSIVKGGHIKKISSDLFTVRWIKHMVSHPVQPSDRASFAEMGLRTRVYSRLLEEKKLEMADIVEEHLWPFAPGAKRLRLSMYGDPIDTFQSGLSLKKKQLTEVNRITSGLIQDINNTTDTKLSSSHGIVQDWMIDQITENQGGKGIVLSLGRGNLRFALHFLNMLRNIHKSKLPVEIYYYGEDDLPFYMRNFLESYQQGVRCIDIEKLELFDPSLSSLSKQGWALKPFTLLATNFSEAILVDADVVFLDDPERLFESKGYKETGTLFFHDRDHFREGASVVIQDFLHSQLGRQGPSAYLKESKFWKKKGIYQQESGVVVVDKRKRSVFAALFFAAWQNTGLIRDKTTYRVFWGDKESYWLSFELAGFPYYFVEHYAGGIGDLQVSNGEEGEGEFCSTHPMHFLPIESTEFQSNKDKRSGNIKTGRPFWFNGSLLKNKDQSDEVFLSNTNWTVDIQWKFYENSERWCVESQNQNGSLADFGIENFFYELINSAKQADLEFEKLNII